jgi:hypothetical protein
MEDCFFGVGALFIFARMLKWLIAIWICWPLGLLAQSNTALQAKKDSTPLQNSVAGKDSLTPLAKDSLSKTSDSLQRMKDSLAKLATAQAAKPTFVQEIRQEGIAKKSNGKDGLFYAVCCLLLLLGIFRSFFSRYFDNIFKLFSQTSLKQKQTQDQLQQSPLPSFLLNLLFFVVGGLYLGLLINHVQGKTPQAWFLIVCMGTVAAIYLVKYFALQFSGWAFDVYEAANNYGFIVFTTNKMLGLVLIPFVVMLAFTGTSAGHFAHIASLFCIGGFLVYRYFAGASSVRSTEMASPIHFFLYICAFEIAPLLVIYKVLFKLLSGNP